MVYLKRLEGIGVRFDYAIQLYMLSVVAIIPFVALVILVDLIFPVTSSVIILIGFLGVVALVYYTVFLLLARRTANIDTTDIALIKSATAKIPFASRIIGWFFPVKTEAS